MNPQTTISYLAATANIARSDRSAARGWRAAQARAATEAAAPRRSPARVVGAALALLLAIAGLGR